MIEILRTLVNFLISLFSGELPGIYYIWIIALLIVQIIQSTLNYNLFNKKEKFSKYTMEGLLAFLIIWIGSMLLSKLLAFIIEDSVINKTELTHYFVSLIVLTIFVVITCIADLIQKTIKNRNMSLLTFLIVSLITSVLSFKLLLPLTGGSFTLSKSFINTLIIVVTGIIVLLVSIEEKYVDEE
ncbi:DUF5823 family protein [Bacillus cereus]|uniref:Uncharacterized protein n=1 Tax=Bacillus cereus TaxID=1396 RepID=A0A2B9DSJ4_BACCE|nr:DUF5823 family protein [Bacillus cereus]PGM91515.1 hypothetical protein CN958_18105 [Bacillus cereus]